MNQTPLLQLSTVLQPCYQAETPKRRLDPGALIINRSPNPNSPAARPSPSTYSRRSGQAHQSQDGARKPFQQSRGFADGPERVYHGTNFHVQPQSVGQMSNSQQLTRMTSSRTQSSNTGPHGNRGPISDGKWNGNNHSRSESFSAAPQTPSRGGYRNGNRPPLKQGHRRGSQGQKSGGQFPVQNMDLNFNHADNSSWKLSRRSNNIPQLEMPRGSNTCRNRTAPGMFEEGPCNCSACNERNRSIWVRVQAEESYDVLDTQSRLKFGLGERFGSVQDVFPAQSKSRDAFIVRLVTVKYPPGGWLNWYRG